MFESPSPISPEAPEPGMLASVETALSPELVEGLQAQVADIEKREEGIYKLFGGAVAGDSSFRDIFLNRIGACKSDIRYLASLIGRPAEGAGEDDDEDDPEKIIKSINLNLGYAERYLTLVESFPEYRQVELSSRGGMFPDVSKKADELTVSGASINRINYYIEQSEMRLVPGSQMVN